MMAKAPFAPITTDLAPRKRRLDLSSVPPRPDTGDGVVAANAEAISAQWGAAAAGGQPAPTALLVPAPDPQYARAPSRRLANVHFLAPASLVRQLKLRAAEQGATTSSLIIQALAAAGYEIDPVDLMPDRRKVGERA